MIVEARFYPDLADELVRGATAVLSEAASSERFEVPGAFEIPGAIRMALQAQERASPRRQFDGFVALGCVIRGETTHYDYVCQESARGLQDLVLKFGIALGYGILTVETFEQAWARARVDQKNKGGDAARACLAMIDLKRRLGLLPG
jgi:6,7-dimethyl-8-ribityllumazine synthase